MSLIPTTDVVGKIRSTAGNTMNDLIDKCEEELLPEKKLAPRTKKLLTYRLDRIRKDHGGKVVETFEIKFVAEYLDDNFKRHA